MTISAAGGKGTLGSATATHQAAHDGANTYAERTVLGNRSWLLIPDSLRQRHGT
jgi:hypothetical protein